MPSGSLPTVYVSAGILTIRSEEANAGASDGAGLVPVLGMTTGSFDVAVEAGGVDPREKIRNPATARTASPITENNMTGIRDRLRSGFGKGSCLIAGSAFGVGSDFAGGSDFGVGSGFAVGLSSGTGASFTAGSGSVPSSGRDGAGASLGTALIGF